MGSPPLKGILKENESHHVLQKNSSLLSMGRSNMEPM